MDYITSSSIPAETSAATISPNISVASDLLKYMMIQVAPRHSLAWIYVEEITIYRAKVIKRMNEITPYSGTSFPFGKRETIDFIEAVLPDKIQSKILDVGPGRGVYNYLLKQKGYQYLDAVEVYKPYIEAFKLHAIYQTVYHCNIIGFNYPKIYDLVIMGDVVEHLYTSEAQAVVQYAQKNCNRVIIAVPYLLPQKGSQLDGSGDHRQPDLTREVFLSRYPGFELLTDNDQLGIFYYLNA